MARLRAGELVMAQEIYSIPPEIDQEPETDEEAEKTTTMVGLLNDWQQAVGDERRSGEHPDTPPGLTWHPDPTQPSVPSGAHARITANIEAIHTLRTVQTEQRPAGCGTRGVR